MRLKYVAREFDDRLGAEVTTLERLSVSQYRGVIPSSENSVRIQEPSSYEKYKVVQPGDLVLNRFNAYKGALGISRYDGVVSPDYMTVKLDTSRVDIRYIEYFLRSVETSAAIKMSMSGMGSSDPDSSAFSRLDKDDLFNLPLPVTDLETQCRIADYLDKEISEMDALIEEFEGLASDLKKRVRVLRSKRIYGVTSNHLRKLWSIVQKVNDISHSKVFIALDNMSGWTGRADPQISETAVEGTPYQTGDLLFGKLRPYLAKVYQAESSGVAVGDIHVYRPSIEVDPTFLKHLLLTPEFISYAKMSSNGVKMPRVEWTSLSQFKFALPPIEAQHNLALELDEELSNTNTLIEESTRLIENLKARKTALITEVVTGRKEV